MGRSTIGVRDVTASATLDIAEVVVRTGVSVSVLHVWERKGILRPVGRVGLRRQYDAEVVARIGTVLAFQRGGFTLAEIAVLLTAARPQSTFLFAEQAARLREQRARLDVAIEALDHAVACDAPDPLRCPHFTVKAMSLLPATE